MRLHTLFLIILISAGCTDIDASNDTANIVHAINDRNGLPIITINGVTAVTAEFHFWGNNWKWANTNTELQVDQQKKYILVGNNTDLDFSFKANILHNIGSNVSWSYEFRSNKDINGIIGGGIVFKLNKDIIDILGTPEIMKNNRGWYWGMERDQRITVTFSPSVERVFFERGNAEEIRAFIFNGKIPQGIKAVTMELSLPKSASLEKTISERFDTPLDSIPSYINHIHNLPIDFSFLNKGERPAGKHGFLKAEGEILRFEDGTSYPFWGTNITSYMIFQTKKSDVIKQAKRLSKLGFNLVRIHHHDSPWVNPNIFGRKGLSNTSKLNAEMLDKIHWWIKCLKDEGIYIWLDLHAQRYFLEGDNIYGYDEIKYKSKKKEISLKGYNYVNPSMQNAMKKFNRQYLQKINKYTGNALINEPAIIALLITNENDITHHFGNYLLPDQNVPLHNKIYMDYANTFAIEHNLPNDKTWLSWKHGPSKIFLNDLEHNFNMSMINDLKAIGVKVPIATTNTWGNNPISSLPALMAGDVIDIHAYGKVLEIESNPVATPNMLNWISAGQVLGMPVTVSEWNVSPFPTQDRHISPLIVASKASQQGWDAVMQYAYSQEPFHYTASLSNWHMFNDPAYLTTMPAAALMYRRGDVQEANTNYVFTPEPKTFYYQKISPENSIALRTASEIGKLAIKIPHSPELPWINETSLPSNAISFNDFNKSFINKDSNSVVSDTNEIYRDWSKGFFTVNTSKTQLAAGWLRDKNIKLDNVIINLKTKNACVIVQSITNQPISNSKKILISMSGQSQPSNGNKLPFRSEKIQGTISINAPPGLFVHYINDKGTKVHYDFKFTNGKYIIELDKIPFTNWISLEHKSGN
jgi:hypothetical protein